MERLGEGVDEGDMGDMESSSSESGDDGVMSEFFRFLPLGAGREKEEGRRKGKKEKRGKSE